MIFLHVGALLAPFTFNWGAFWVFAILVWITNGLGVCLGYHRLLTHRSFKCSKTLEYLFAVCGLLSSQGGAINWVATHRYHHVISDKETDPHSPRNGFLWAHMLWFMYRNPILETDEFRNRWAPELMKDPVHRFLSKQEWMGQYVLGIMLFALGGLPFVVWGIFLRTIVALHITWLVNSASHTWGYMTYDCKDNSRNLWWVGFLAFGEGWHNNHHAFQFSAAHGLRWWEFDLTYITIKALSILGIASDIRLPSLVTIQNKAMWTKQAKLLSREREAMLAAGSNIF